MSLYDEQFGRMVKYYRQIIGMNQEELSKKLGYKHKSSINKIESGLARVPVDKVPEFAKALGITVEELTSDINVERIEKPKMLNKEVTDKLAANYLEETTNDLRKVTEILVKMDKKELSKVYTILKTFME